MQFIPPVKTSDTNNKGLVSFGTTAVAYVAVYPAENVILKDDGFCQISVRHDSMWFITRFRVGIVK